MIPVFFEDVLFSSNFRKSWKTVGEKSGNVLIFWKNLKIFEYFWRKTSKFLKIWKTFKANKKTLNDTKLTVPSRFYSGPHDFTRKLKIAKGPPFANFKNWISQRVPPLQISKIEDRKGSPLCKTVPSNRFFSSFENRLVSQVSGCPK